MPAVSANPRNAARKALWRDRFHSRWISPFLFLLLWEAGSRSGIIPERVLAAPSTVLATLGEMIRSGELPANLAVSLGRALTGLAVGAVIGITLGLVAGLSRTGDDAIDPLIQIKRSIPVVALVPLFIVWFGIGELTKIALIAFATVFPIYLNLYQGVKAIDHRLIEAAHSFGLSRYDMIRHVILPGSVPSLMVGLRHSYAIAVLMLVIAEQVNASSGLGHLTNDARDFMRTDIIVVCLLMYAAMGLGGDYLLRSIERRLLVWRPASASLRS